MAGVVETLKADNAAEQVSAVNPTMRGAAASVESVIERGGISGTPEATSMDSGAAGLRNNGSIGMEGRRPRVLGHLGDQVLARNFRPGPAWQLAVLTKQRTSSIDVLQKDGRWLTRHLDHIRLPYEELSGEDQKSGRPVATGLAPSFNVQFRWQNLPTDTLDPEFVERRRAGLEIQMKFSPHIP
ncbi:hypothetical protein HPB51_012681 [Rhipicephalus microplus]|uniref:Uncharacterized protein n=1 Tax=Rhipicephalus microplus TaxID=6941 RepID=A0A9J6D5R9_RHIMP|nr:hypothetical protein HPB51_012681 [Rhipicephalus microplus]